MGDGIHDWAIFAKEPDIPGSNAARIEYTVINIMVLGSFDSGSDSNPEIRYAKHAIRAIEGSSMVNSRIHEGFRRRKIRQISCQNKKAKKCTI